MKIKFKLNNENVTINRNPSEKLINYLREINLTSVKNGCNERNCGACTVLLNDVPVESCCTTLAQVDNSTVMTLEGFVKTVDYEDISKGFTQANVKMCGFCNAGKIFTAYQLVQDYVRPSKDNIRKEISFLKCSCTETDALVDGIYFACAAKRARLGKKNGK